MPSVAGIKAGNAYVVIGALNDTDKMLVKIGRHIKRWGASLTGIGTDLLFKGAFAALPGVAMLKVATDFDDAMRKVQARTGATDAEMNTLRKTAREAGTDIGISANEIARIFDTLSQNKFDIADINSMARPIALLAKATGGGSETDMQTATDAMSQVINAFHMDAADASKVADILTVAANQSNFALNDLSEALSKVSPMAATMNMSLEETIAVLAQMRNAGIEAESSGIGLRNILLNASTTKDTDKFNESLKALTGQTIEFEDALGNLKDPAAILFETIAKTKKLGSAQRTNLLGELFGKRAVVPAIAAGAADKDFKKLMANLVKAGGEAERVSRDMEKGIGGTFRAIKNSVMNLSISIGNILSPMLGAFRQKVVDLVAALQQWVDKNPHIVAAIAMATVGLIVFGVTLIATGITLKLVGSALIAFGVLLTALKAIFSVVVIVFTTGVSLIVSAIMTIPAVVGAVIAVFTTFVSLFSAALTAIGTALISLLGLPFLAAIAAPLTALLAVLGAIFVMVFGLINGFKILGSTVSNIFIGCRNAAADFFNFLSSLWANITKSAVAAFKVVKAGVTDAFKLAAIGDFKSAMEVALASIKVGWLEIRNVVLETWDKILIAATHTFDRIFERAKQLAERMQFVHLNLWDMEGLEKLIKSQKEARFINEEARRLGNDPGTKELRGKQALAADERNRELEAAKAKLNAIDQKNAPKLKGLDLVDALANLVPKAKQVLKGIGGVPKPGMMPGPIKALEGLEKGSIEAAKSFYEASRLDTQDIPSKQLNALNGILASTEKLAENLGLA